MLLADARARNWKARSSMVPLHDKPDGGTDQPQTARERAGALVQRTQNRPTAGGRRGGLPIDVIARFGRAYTARVVGARRLAREAVIPRQHHVMHRTRRIAPSV
jgi:hypothetical protein